MGLIRRAGSIVATRRGMNGYADPWVQHPNFLRETVMAFPLPRSGI